jgi:choline dehydrogenase
VQYLRTGKGALAINVCTFTGSGGHIHLTTISQWGESAAFCRSDDPILFPPESYPERLADSTSGPNSPDLEIFTTPIAYKDHGLRFFRYHTYALHACLLR